MVTSTKRTKAKPFAARGLPNTKQKNMIQLTSSSEPLRTCPICDDSILEETTTSKGHDTIFV